MTYFTTKNDVLNHADGLIGDTTPEQTEKLAQYIIGRAWDAGLEWGQDWGDLLESLTMDELVEASGALNN